MQGVVTNSMYLGTQTRYWIRVGDVELQAFADTALQFQNPDTVSLVLPKERLWMVPPAD